MPRRCASRQPSTMSSDAQCSSYSGLMTSKFIRRLKNPVQYSSAKASGEPIHSQRARHCPGEITTRRTLPSAQSTVGYIGLSPDRTVGGSEPRLRVSLAFAMPHVFIWARASSAETSRCCPPPPLARWTRPTNTANAPTTPTASEASAPGISKGGLPGTPLRCSQPDSPNRTSSVTTRSRSGPVWPRSERDATTMSGFTARRSSGPTPRAARYPGRRDSITTSASAARPRN